MRMDELWYDDGDEDGAGLDDFERYAWEWRQAELMLMADPYFDYWLDYIQEQNSHDCTDSVH